jgi:hypothetical protein
VALPGGRITQLTRSPKQEDATCTRIPRPTPSLNTTRFYSEVELAAVSQFHGYSPSGVTRGGHSLLQELPTSKGRRDALGRMRRLWTRLRCR